MKMHAKETPWAKYLRLEELARHRTRCKQMKCAIDMSMPKQSPQQQMNRERSDLEQGMGLWFIALAWFPAESIDPHNANMESLVL